MRRAMVTMSAEAKRARAEAKATGLKRYSAGMPCIRGHTAERFVSTNGCTQCSYGHTKAFRAESPGLAREIHRVETLQSRLKQRLRWAEPPGWATLENVR